MAPQQAREVWDSEANAMQAELSPFVMLLGGDIMKIVECPRLSKAGVENCPICHDSIDARLEMWAMGKCLHKYHFNCIEAMIRRTTRSPRCCVCERPIECLTRASQEPLSPPLPIQLSASAVSNSTLQPETNRFNQTLPPEMSEVDREVEKWWREIGENKRREGLKKLWKDHKKKKAEQDLVENLRKEKEDRQRRADEEHAERLRILEAEQAERLRRAEADRAERKRREDEEHQTRLRLELEQLRAQNQSFSMDESQDSHFQQEVDPDAEARRWSRR